MATAAMSLPPKPPTTRIVLELSQPEVDVLLSLLRRVGGTGRHRRTSDGVLRALSPFCGVDIHPMAPLRGWSESHITDF